VINTGRLTVSKPLKPEAITRTQQSLVNTYTFSYQTTAGCSNQLTTRIGQSHT